MPTLYVMHDDAGPWPVLWREPDPPEEEPGRAWDYLGEVEEAAAVRALEALHRRRAVETRRDGKRRFEH